MMKEAVFFWVLTLWIPKPGMAPADCWPDTQSMTPNTQAVYATLDQCKEAAMKHPMHGTGYILTCDEQKGDLE
jgi:hypothetical protein